MGRVSKYKKIKPHDPFYRGPRKFRKGVMDLRPDVVDDQPVSKSFLHLMKRAENKQKQKTNRRIKFHNHAMTESSATVTTQTTHKDNDDDDLKEIGGMKKDGPMFTRRKGETLKSYLERMDMEANAKIMEEYRKSRKPSERRKRRLDERRRKAVAKRKGLNQELLIESTELKDEVRFGEVVQAPPQLKAKPRGSGPITGSSSKSLLLHQKLSNPCRKQTKKLTPSPVVGLKRKLDLELERERAISVYRQRKKTALEKNIN